ncbi:hypothetical protein SRHO_G00152730 [Serrasalmus rhombeus]
MAHYSLDRRSGRSLECNLTPRSQWQEKCFDIIAKRNRSETPAIRALRSGRNARFSFSVAAEGAAYLASLQRLQTPRGNRSSSDFTPLSRLIQTPQPPFRRAAGGSSALTASGAQAPRRTVRSWSPQLRAFTHRRRGDGTFSEITDFVPAYND